MNTKLLVLKPQIDKAATTLDGPGTEMIFNSGICVKSISINSFPGSLIPGVPASVTRARFYPSFKRFKMSCVFVKELCW